MRNNMNKKQEAKLVTCLLLFAIILISVARLFRKHEHLARLREDHPHHETVTVTTSEANKKGRADDDDGVRAITVIKENAGETMNRKNDRINDKNDRFRCPDVHKHAEYDGAVVLDGVSVGPVEDFERCCEKCENAVGCNVWVFCKENWCKGQCWLKRIENPEIEKPMMRNGAVEGDLNVYWTSGVLIKDFVRENGDDGVGYNRKNNSMNDDDDNGSKLKKSVTITTAVGNFRITLKPEWHKKSVEYLSALANAEDACKGKSCKLYRVEPGFLVQGVLRSFTVKSNKETFQFQKLMEYGDVGWAGGSAGPDFFVYLGVKPATWLKFDHTIWGKVEDKASLDVLENIVKMDSHTPGGPNTMRFLREEMPIDVI